MSLWIVKLRIVKRILLYQTFSEASECLGYKTRPVLHESFSCSEPTQPVWSAREDEACTPISTLPLVGELEQAAGPTRLWFHL